MVQLPVTAVWLVSGPWPGFIGLPATACVAGAERLAEACDAGRPVANGLGKAGGSYGTQTHVLIISLTLHMFSLSHIGRFRASTVPPSKKPCVHVHAYMRITCTECRVCMKLTQSFPGCQRDAECTECSSVVLSACLQARLDGSGFCRARCECATCVAAWHGWHAMYHPPSLTFYFPPHACSHLILR